MTLESEPQVELVFITYIIFAETSTIKLTHFSPSQGSSLPYQFIGIDSIESASAVFGGSGFTSDAEMGLTCTGSRCPDSHHDTLRGDPRSC